MVTESMAQPSRPAATVVLLRDTPAGIETWLMRRVREMAFAAGMTVFPGGRVDERDGDPDVPWAGEPPDRLAARLGVPTALVRATLVAAVRETFEETGVLLTRPAQAAPPDTDLAAAEWLDARRHQVEAREVSFAALLVELGLAVDADLIRAWARWITPEPELRRYDTFFYVSALPAGARARPETREAEHAQWLRPADALAEHDVGQRPMLPPTVTALHELTAFARVADVLAAADHRTLDPVRPRMDVRADGVRTVTLPDGQIFELA